MSAAGLRAAALACAAAFAAGPASAQPALGKLWFETQLADPERGAQTGRGVAPMDARFYRFDGGIYQSVFSRIALPLPVLGAEAVVSVRESVISRRPDGMPITAHVMFVPGPLGVGLDTQDGVSAIVVTRLRDDRPKDRDSVLRNFEPQGEALRAEWERKGVTHSRVPTPMGEALQRVVRNRLAADPFPYRTQVDNGSVVRSFGATRFVVAEGDSLIEFSQVVPCGDLPEAACRDKAVGAIERLVASVKEFLLLPPTAASK